MNSVLAIGGVGGLAVGLAGREILENLFTGLIILSSNPFEVGAAPLRMGSPLGSSRQQARLGGALQQRRSRIAGGGLGHTMSRPPDLHPGPKGAEGRHGAAAPALCLCRLATKCACCCQRPLKCARSWLGGGALPPHATRTRVACTPAASPWAGRAAHAAPHSTTSRHSRAPAETATLPASTFS